MRKPQVPSKEVTHVESTGGRPESRYITYTCSQCGAEDHVGFWANELIPPMLICWNCKAGRGDTGQMLMAKTGMFPQLEA